MIQHRHFLTATALAAALLGAMVPAHAGLIGGSGSLGGGLSGGIGPIGGAARGNAAAQGALRTPSPRPAIARAEEKAEATKDQARAPGVSASAEGGASSDGRAPQANGSANASVKR